MTMESGVVITPAEVEGPAATSDWSRWVAAGHAPSGRAAGWPDAADDHLAVLAASGINSVMVTLEWASLQPGPREHDHLAIERAEQLLTRIGEFGLSRHVCLVDGTLPGWFADDEGGFDDDRSRGLIWPRHVDWVGERFGHLVDSWIPQREAIRRVVRSHVLGIGPTSRRAGRITASTTNNSVANAILAEAEAWRLLRGSVPVASFQTARLVRPVRDDVKAPPQAAWLDELLWHSWVRAFTDGVVVVGGGAGTDVPTLRDGFDRLIVAVRPALAVDGTGSVSRAPMPIVDAHHEAADRARSIAGERTLVVAGSVDQVPDDGRARLDLADDMVAVAADVGAEAFWLTSPIDGWHWEHGDQVSPGVIDRSGATRLAADALAIGRMT